MATQTRKQSNTAPRHLKSPETPKGASRQEVTAAHRRRHQAERKRPRRRSNSERLYYEKLLPYAEEQHRGNQRALHTGVGWLFALPVVLLVIQKLTGSSKIAILLAWIAGMFIIAAALIHISFADYELQKYLKDLTTMVPEVENADLGSLLPVDENGEWTITAEQLRTAIEQHRIQRLGEDFTIRLSRETIRKLLRRDKEDEA